MLNIQNFENIFYLYLGIINLINFLFFGVDKFKSMKGYFRISEKTLFILTLLGGFVGGVLGMLAFRHKTVKNSFQIRFWVIVFLWIIGIIYFMIR